MVYFSHNFIFDLQGRVEFPTGGSVQERVLDKARDPFCRAQFRGESLLYQFDTAAPVDLVQRQSRQ